MEQLNQEKLKTREIEGTIKTKKYLLCLLIFIGVIGASAPFYHIFSPKIAKEKKQLEKNYDAGKIKKVDYLSKRKELKAKYKYVGFSNKRRFLYAIGLPISLFMFTFILLFVSSYISNTSVKRGAIYSALAGQFTSLYFILWTIWAYKKNEDFPIELYYLSIVVLSFLISVSIYHFIKRKEKLVATLFQNIRLLTRFIVKNKPKEDTALYVRNYMETFKKLKR